MCDKLPPGGPRNQISLGIMRNGLGCKGTFCFADRAGTRVTRTHELTVTVTARERVSSGVDSVCIVYVVYVAGAVRQGQRFARVVSGGGRCTRIIVAVGAVI